MLDPKTNNIISKFLRKYNCFNPDPKQTSEYMLAKNNMAILNPNELINNIGTFKRPVTEEKPKIIIIWVKFGSFLNKYLLTTKIKLIPINDETIPVPKVVIKSVKVVSELNVASSAEITFLNSITDCSGRPVAINDKLFFKKLVKSLNNVNIARTLIK